MAAAVTVVTSLHTYERGQLRVAMKALTEEANSAATRGYQLVGYQVVESERVVTALYRGAPRAVGDVSLVGE